MSELQIRDQNEADRTAVKEVVRQAFLHKPYAAGTEAFIIDALWTRGMATIALVAEADGRILGQAAFSPVTITGSDGQVTTGWHGLGPIAVLPEVQKKGVGSVLMEVGLTKLRALGSKGCVLVGDPAYYERFGFENLPQLQIPGVPPENLLALPFTDALPAGEIVFDEAFQATS
ncbi:N-acetyltransferase [Afifella sp. JA880]|uniref:GNAT family N-acetyltransferase n=1 Tax=Afifella sp. JA880 TaxID=2975280 RepID=UPI0021BB424C|nr:N-acetyltransferase [Afifella sp. JA880]MCT8268119.1 N-acetyltransferase [Afifella sp. JA880]